MPEAQLILFPEPRPLLERFGAEFFRAIPKRPGVYIMSGDAARVLYIGKASNLRQRLCSYKYVKCSRKVLRLAARVRAITWEICDDPVIAGLRENELLRVHKPVFNVINTRAEHYPFVGLRTMSGELLFRLTKCPEPLPDEELFGAFKGLPLVRAALAALFRLFWRAQYPASALVDLPSALLHSRLPVTGTIHVGAPGTWHSAIREFFCGSSDALITELEMAVPRRVTRFEETFHAHDVELLREFFARGPQRNSRLHELFCLETRCIPQAELDDLLVLREQYAGG